MISTKPRRTLTDIKQQRSKVQKTDINQLTRKVTPFESRKKENSVVVSITGLSEHKNEIHDIVTSLGGRYVISFINTPNSK